MQAFSCFMIMNQYMNFNGRIDTGEKALTLCCESLPGNAHVPGVSLEGDAEDVLERFLGMRNTVITNSLKEGDRAKTVTKENSWLGCKRCVNYQKGDWQPQLMVTYVNLSMYPAPCQCRCCYCDVAKRWENTESVQTAYEKMFAVLELAEKRGVIAPNAVWQISSGEITIHPYKERIYELVGSRRAVYYTNGFIYDEAIAGQLKRNEGSAINLSIDAGTPETWREVKGVDNFEEVCMNLADYFKASSRPGQISLKYIILPGINDSEKDYAGLMEIMDVLKVPHLTLSWDIHIKYGSNRKQHTALLSAAARLARHCRQNGITIDMFAFAESERAEIMQIASRL